MFTDIMNNEQYGLPQCRKVTLLGRGKDRKYSMFLIVHMKKFMCLIFAV